MSALDFVRLSVAAERHGLTVGALRREAAKGRLAVSRVAGKDWTTEAAIAEMFERCRAQSYRPVSTFDPPFVEPDVLLPSGSSSTPEPSIALTAALGIARALKGRSPPTSRKNTRRTAANVVSGKFGSPT